jgi:hypothetical protein
MSTTTNPAGTTEMSDLRSGLPPRGLAARPVPARPLPDQRLVAKKPRPDPGPLRIALGLTGMATASALVSALLGPAAGASAAVDAGKIDTAAVTGTSPAVRHVIRYVQLAPGQTAPPRAVLQQAPTPKPRVVVVTTKQSGG